MVPAVSGGGPRAPPYSGLPTARGPPAPTGLSPPPGRPSSRFGPGGRAPAWGPTTPGGPRPPRFGRLPLSLAATRGTTVVSSSSGYWDVSVRRVRAPSRGRPAFSRAGCPIRTPRGHGPCAPRPGFSQLSASFIASGSLGIRRAPCLRFPRARAARPRPPGRRRRPRAGRARRPAGARRGARPRARLPFRSSRPLPGGAGPSGGPARPARRANERCRIRGRWRMPGSNRRPPACKAGALPTELIPPRPPAVVPPGFEPGASTLSVWRSDRLSYGTRPRPARRRGRGWRCGARRRPRARATRKEVFQPHLPVRLPCYDLAPVAGLALDRPSRARASGAPGSHGLTGGVYKARERIHRAVADARLLANPASRGRVADPDPNRGRLSGFAPPRGVAARCAGHCNTCVAPDVGAVLI